MRRKLVKQGAATLMISLPSKWLRENNLEKGDEIELSEVGRDVIIKPLNESSKAEKARIDVSLLTESSIRTLLTNAYRLGYDRISINFKDKKTIKIIQEVVERNLIGFEIISRTGKSCEIENITEPSKDQFNNVFSKVFANIEDLFEMILSGEKENLEETERKIYQFDNFCRRVISKNNLSRDTPFLWSFHTQLIHAQRDLYFLLKSSQKIPKTAEVLYLTKEAKKIFDILRESYLNKNISNLEEIHQKEKELIYQKGYSSLKKNPVIIHHLMDAIRNFYLASSPLMALFISSD